MQKSSCIDQETNKDCSPLKRNISVYHKVHCWWNVTRELSISEMLANDCSLTGNNGLLVATSSPLWRLTAGVAPASLVERNLSSLLLLSL